MWQNSGDERDEDDEEHVSDDESDDDDEDIPYNPKNLPLGWDGKVGNQYASVVSVLKQYNQRVQLWMIHTISALFSPRVK